jgi:hypothetical protein
MIAVRRWQPGQRLERRVEVAVQLCQRRRNELADYLQDLVLDASLLHGKRGHGLSDQIQGGHPDRVGVPEQLGNGYQPQRVMPGAQGLSHGWQQRRYLVRGIQALHGVGPQIVGTHDAFLGDRQQRDLRGELFHIDLLAADQRDRPVVAPAEQRQGQQGAGLDRTEAADDLLSENLLR